MKTGLAVLLTTLFSYAAAKEVICYWDSSSTNRPGAGKVTVDDLNPGKCTIYIYQYASLLQENEFTIFKLKAHNQNVDIDLEGYKKFVAMKNTNPKLKTLLGIGVYDGQNSFLYTVMMADPKRRSSFVTNAVRFVRDHGFGGLDIYYLLSYPRGRANFTALVTELRAELQLHDLLLTAAIITDPYLVNLIVDVQAISTHLDFINVLSFDLHAPLEHYADHLAPFEARASDNGNGADVKSVMAGIMDLGAPASKLVVGLPMFGNTWRVPGTEKSPPALSGMKDVPHSGIPGSAGPYTDKQGILSYLEICEKIAEIADGWTVVKDPTQKIGPYAYSVDQWIGYDDAAMVTAKTTWADSQGFGGVMVWDVSFDDIRNTCGDGAWPLLTAAYDSLNLST